MARALPAIQQQHPFTFEVVDVDADDALVALYDELVPVLVHEGVEVCHWFLDRERLLQIVAAAPPVI